MRDKTAPAVLKVLSDDPEINWRDEGGPAIYMKVDHSFLDRRSLAFHVAIAEKLRSDPKLLEKDAIKNIFVTVNQCSHGRINQGRSSKPVPRKEDRLSSAFVLKWPRIVKVIGPRSIREVELSWSLCDHGRFRKSDKEMFYEPEHGTAVHQWSTRQRPPVQTLSC